VTRGRLIVFLLLCLAVAACGGGGDGGKSPLQGAQRSGGQSQGPGKGSRSSEQGGPPTPPGPAKKPCSLLDESKISDAFGPSAEPGQAKSFGISHTCDWKLSDGSNVRLSVFDTPTAYVRGKLAVGYRPVSGVGEEAAFRAKQPVRTASQIEVRLPDRMFFIQLVATQIPRGKERLRPGAPTDEAQFIALAKEVASHLE
jgi:hypothetical protein